MERQAQREAIGRRLKEARERACCTQAEAAAATGVNRSAVSNWERGRHTPDLIQFKRLVALYGVTGHQVLFGESLFEMTAGECAELARRSRTFSDDLQRKMELLLTLMATAGANNAQSRPTGPDFEPTGP